MLASVITHADGTSGGYFFTSVCLCVCLFFSHDISKTDAARMTTLDIEMFQDESCKLRIGQKIKRPCHVSEKIAGVGLCTLVSAGFF